ncbi:D-alanyl-D-alanine carboxypeptidase [Hoeflea halophila]|uniref:D-alanyl-D-alanine carboxypeptidase n=1 Tax=Hoeflea halophila TaxID=714899 RepID=A0A286IF90_9HYPH|nr:D-alanyl-D-alanine carboxypeptidase [Hoeflea halophila]SOE18687.1 D-alanyl-D-alanine carboxypeptidase [Hoeflea halophila]
MYQRKLSSIDRFAALSSSVLQLLALVGLALALGSAPAAANSKYAGIVVDAKTGKTLYAHDADELRYPASLTKMMTLYLVFEALERGAIRLDTRIKFSANAAKEPPTKLGVGTGRSITVEQGIYALVTKSANDASTAIAEHLGGSEAKFARMMTAKARALGMSKTTFHNAHGLPNSKQVTTARDMARLGIALREHYPRQYKYFSARSFTFGKTRMGNHNRLLGTVRGVDGIKTGYTRASGFNLVSSVIDRDRSIVAVVMGGRTGASRNAQMKDLIARYLPKASTRGSGNLIARGAMTNMAIDVAALELPKVGPVPSQRHEANQRLAFAYAAPTPEPVVGRSALVNSLIAQKVAIPTPAPAVVPPMPVAAAPNEAIDPVTTASTAPRDGWMIQIGAMPDRNAAVALLTEAQDAGGNSLTGTEPFTMAYAKGNEQLYRARFGGFDGQAAATRACATLKKKGYACWATAN